MVIKTLVIDDHELVRAGIRLMLNDINPNMDIHEVSCAAEAMLKIQREPEFDAVLMDIAVPDRDGFLLLKQIRSRLHCPIVVISGMEDEATVERVKQFGVAAFIPKSSDASYIRRQFKMVVDQCIDHLTRNPRPPKPFPHSLARHYAANHIPRVELTEDMVNLINSLTKRQKEVLELLAAGKTNKQICATLNLSDGTVKNHVTAILSRLGVNRRTKVALLARQYASKCG